MSFAGGRAVLAVPANELRETMRADFAPGEPVVVTVEKASTQKRLTGPNAFVDATPLDPSVLRRSADPHAGAGGMLSDGINVATAAPAPCGTIVSFDKRLRLFGGLQRILPDDIGDFLAR